MLPDLIYTRSTAGRRKPSKSSLVKNSNWGLSSARKDPSAFLKNPNKMLADQSESANSAVYTITIKVCKNGGDVVMAAGLR